MPQRAFAIAAMAALGAIWPTAAGAGSDGCPKRFRGTIERETDSGHAAADLTGRDIESTIAVDFGNRKNYTLYAGDFRIPPKAVGTTIEAPAGKTLMTAFVRARDGDDLREGQRLRVGRDPVTVVIDSGGGARAVSTGASGTVRVRRLGGDRVCFTFDYADDLQRLEGTISARLVELSGEVDASSPVTQEPVSARS
jgi:hypothetical protein